MEQNYYRGGESSRDFRWTPLEEMKQIEVEERGNSWFDDTEYIGQNFVCIWVTPNKDIAEHYGSDVRIVNVTGAECKLEDGDDGHLFIKRGG